MTNTAIVEAEVISTAQLIQEGIAKGIDLVALKEILKLREIDDAFKARKAYAKDFATAQANIMPVVKTKLNKQTNSKYSDLADVIETSQPIYTKEGFSVTFNEGDCPKENHVRILADVLHYQGHKEQYHYDVPMDGKGLRGNENMTAIHGKSSSVSYGRRYLMCMIWNIPTSDNDGNTQVLPTINAKQLSNLLDCLNAKELSEKKLLEFLKIEKLEDLLEKDYTKALAAINSARKESK